MTDNALKMDLYYITPDELDEIVARCEGKHIQQVVYSTYHKGFTRVCFGCMQVDTTILRTRGAIEMTPTQQWASNLMTRYEMLVHPEQLDETANHLVGLAKAILAESEQPND